MEYSLQREFRLSRSRVRYRVVLPYICGRKSTTFSIRAYSVDSPEISSVIVFTRCRCDIYPAAEIGGRKNAKCIETTNLTYICCSANGVPRSKLEHNLVLLLFYTKPRICVAILIPKLIRCVGFTHANVYQRNIY